MCEGPHPYIAAENTVQVRWVFSTPGGEANNVFHILLDSPPSAADLALIAEAAEDAWETLIAPYVATVVSLTETIATDLSDENAAQIVNPGGISGLLNSPVLPSNVTVAVTFRTAQRGRSFRGRLFHVGLGESLATGDEITPGTAQNLSDSYETAMSQIAAAVMGGSHAIVSYCSAGVWRTVAVVTPVISYDVDVTIDSQRRRLKGRGR